MKRIKAVLFDLDGTLFHYLPTSGEVFLDYLRSAGFHISEADRVRAEHWVHFYFAHSPEIQDDDRTFGDDQKGFWVNFTRRRLIAFGISPVKAADMAPEVSDHMSEIYKPKIQVPEDAHALLDLLKESGYVLGMVSNRESSFQEEMRKAKVDWQMVMYGGAVHSFTNPDSGSDPSRGAAYNEKADKRSWEHMKVFFAEIFK